MRRATRYEDDVWEALRSEFGHDFLVLRHANRRGRGESWPQPGREAVDAGSPRPTWPDVVVVPASSVAGAFRRTRSGQGVRTLGADEAIAAARAKPERVSLTLDGDGTAAPSHRLTITLTSPGVHSVWDAKHYLLGRRKISRGWQRVGRQMAAYIADFQPTNAWVVVPSLDKLPESRRGDADGILADRADLIKVRWVLREKASA